MRTIAAINLAIVTVILLLILGLGLPRSIDEGVAGLRGPRRAAAEEALEFARDACSDQMDALLTRGFRVESVRRVSPEVSGPVYEPPLTGYEVRLRRLTLFALPAGAVTVREWSIECF